LTQNKKYRTRTELIGDILQAARSYGGGARRTQIMYNAFLPYGQMKEYLTILINNGLLKHDVGNQKFRITEKGPGLLQLYEQIDDLIEKKENQQQDSSYYYQAIECRLLFFVQT
jgi:predicted transcriptional regulator